MTKVQSTPPWKTALWVWLPVLILGLLYGSVYGIRYTQAKSTENRHHAQYEECQAKTNIENKKDAEEVSKGLKPFTGMQVCQSPGTINKGFLGFPSFCCDGYN